MKILSYLLFLVIASQLACSSKKYSITTYVTSLDKRDHFKNKRFKYAYEEFNSDSNLIYEERYATFDYTEKLWGQLISKTTNSYNGLLIESSVTESGFMENQRNKTIELYAYKNNQLEKKITDGEPTVTYSYDANHRLAQERFKGDYPIYITYFYNLSGLKTKQVSYFKDTLTSTTTFSYDGNKKLVDELTVDYTGHKVKHVQYVRNPKGLLLEEKWRNGFDEWRLREDGSVIDQEFYESKKYFYSNNQLSKIISYVLEEPSKVYEFEYQ